MLQQQGKPGRQARLCRCLRWVGRWAGAAGCARAPPYLARPGLLRCVQQLRAAPLRAGAYSYPLPLVARSRALLLAR